MIGKFAALFLYSLRNINRPQRFEFSRKSSARLAYERPRSLRREAMEFSTANGKYPVFLMRIMNLIRSSENKLI